jgi:hypothetical protein
MNNLNFQQLFQIKYNTKVLHVNQNCIIHTEYVMRTPYDTREYMSREISYMNDVCCIQL